MLKTIGRLLTVLLVFIISYLIYMGLFASVSFKKQNMGPWVLVYEKHTGDYSTSGETMDRVYNSLVENENIMPGRGFGLYYDKPGEVETEKLRSIVGCVLDGEDIKRAAELKKKFNITEFPASTCLTASFPYRGTVSIILGVFRVYPQLEKEMKRKNYPSVPVMEIYDAAHGKIDYIAGINIDTGYYDSLIK